MKTTLETKAAWGQKHMLCPPKMPSPEFKVFRMISLAGNGVEDHESIEVQ